MSYLCRVFSRKRLTVLLCEGPPPGFTFVIFSHLEACGFFFVVLRTTKHYPMIFIMWTCRSLQISNLKFRTVNFVFCGDWEAWPNYLKAWLLFWDLTVETLWKWITQILFGNSPQFSSRVIVSKRQKSPGFYAKIKKNTT